MSAEAKHDATTAGADPHEHDHIKHYTKIYVTLLVLFGISVLGPVVGSAVGSKALVLITAFGIALVKAYLVCAHFMHLNIEKRYIGYLLTTTVVFMFLFYAGVSPDVMEHRGRNWENVAAQQETLRAQREHALHPEGHGEGVPAEEH
ncbi:MAG TPA: cytochrome C oxidase subunit IV family protein [Polyangiales bacterium]|jgi:caa(3)-type oxidase subunit IV|nr:cytochrome C oxidase subunit IV family protein [Polyangiales bacterium]